MTKQTLAEYQGPQNKSEGPVFDNVGDVVSEFIVNLFKVAL